MSSACAGISGDVCIVERAGQLLLHDDQDAISRREDKIKEGTWILSVRIGYIEIAQNKNEIANIFNNQMIKFI